MNGSPLSCVYNACGEVLVALRRTKHTVLLWRSGMSADLSTFLSNPKTYQNVLRRLLASVLRDSGSGCWVWQKYRNRRGYGCMTMRASLSFLAHRVSYTLFRDAVPSGMMVCHHCDNPPCCNPSHLFVGTRQDNMDDMKRKGRSPAGTASPNSKLTDADVMEIRRRYEAGERTEDIATRFNIKARNVSWVATGKAWSHLPGAVAPRRPKRRILTAADICSIREMRASGVRATAIAAAFGIHESAVRRNLKPRKRG